MRELSKPVGKSDETPSDKHVILLDIHAFHQIDLSWLKA
jgi:hypothetical protein